MAAAAALTGMPARRRAWNAIPEIYIAKQIDNSRLVTVRDGRREREMAVFTVAVVVLFVFVMAYAVQHYVSIQYGYQIEAAKAEKENLAELNRALRLEEASLRDPQRIDQLARQMGLETPAVGQVMRLDGTPVSQPAGEVLARVSVVSLAQ